MNQSAHSAYQTHQRSEETLRETEARALLSCASQLEAVRLKIGCSREEFGDAIRHNQKLWSIFQAYLCEPDNPLPRDLKILLLNLSRYVDKVSFRAVSQNDPTLLRSLININRTIAAGLAQKPKEEDPAPLASSPPPADGQQTTLITSA